MVRKTGRKKKKYQDTENGLRNGKSGGLKPETKHSILAVFFFVAASILALSFIGQGGSAGGFIYQLLDSLLGRGYFFAPLAFVLIGFSILFSQAQRIVGVTLLGGAFFLLSSLTGLHIIFGPRTGGLLGAIAGSPLILFFDFWAGLAIVLGFFVISLLLILNLPLWQKRKEKETDEKDDVPMADEIAHGAKTLFENMNSAVRAALESKNEEKPPSLQQTIMQPDRQANAGDESPISVRKLSKKFGYKRPPLELLQGDRGTPSSGDIRANANIIKRTLENFGIDVEMGEVSVGPTVTQYTLKPAEGMKLSRITALHSDLSLALAAHPIRIEAPIPGKSLVGIEVPNRSIALVGLRALMEHKIIQDSQSPLLFALGRDVTGNPVFADLSKMPHLLISGATGSGKSVCVHALMTSFLYRNPPEFVRFIVVDPKRVELSIYNDIPHLLTPVITDPPKTIQALRWATKEMDRRYDLLSSHHTRDIASFNAQKTEEGPLPYIIIVIDELADLMATFPREVEASIVRLAQMARAVGIHLVVSTQRPSVEVITGLIKANITSRIAFQVASQIDSRTVLDMSGAEKLLGNGDMLFMAGDTTKPRRIQGAFVSEQEVKRLVDFLRETYEAPEYEEKILETKIDTEREDGWDSDFGDHDPLYEEAKNLIIEAQKASASYLQRRLRVGYARAARLLDLMEARGVVGPGEGAKPREILMRTADQEEIHGNL